MRFVAGAAAGATATTLTYPLESLGWGSCLGSGRWFIGIL